MAEPALPSLDDFLKTNRLSKIHDRLAKDKVTVEDLLNFEQSHLEQFMNDLKLRGFQKSKLTNGIRNLRDEQYRAESNRSKGGSSKGDDDADSRVVHVVVSPEERAMLTKIEEKQKEISENIVKYEDATSKLVAMTDAENKKLNDAFDQLVSLLNERKAQYLRELDEAFTEKEAAIKSELEKSEKYDEQFLATTREYRSMVKDSGVSLVHREEYLAAKVGELVDSSTLIATEAKVTWDWNAKGNEEWIEKGLATINSYEKPIKIPDVRIDNIKPTSFTAIIVPSDVDKSRDRSKGLAVTSFEVRLLKLFSDPRDTLRADDEDEKKEDASGAAATSGATTSTGDAAAAAAAASSTSDASSGPTPAASSASAAGDDEKKEADSDEKTSEEKTDGDSKAPVVASDAVPQVTTVSRADAENYVIDGLEWGCTYSIEARSVNSYGAGRWSAPITAKTEKPEILCVERGTHSTSTWSYSTTSFSQHAVAITVDKDVCVVGIGLFLGTGTTTMKVNVYKGPNSAGAVPVLTGEETTYTQTAMNSTPEEHKFPGEGVIFKAGELMTIENWQKGNNSYRCSSTSASTKSHGGVKWSFSKGSRSPNGTLGQLPCVFFYKL